jgi:TrmH family RNA methyltransferase
LKKSKERRQQKAFVVEGPKMCMEAPSDRVREIYVSEGFLAQEPQRRQFEKYLSENPHLKELVETVSDGVFSSMSDTRTPQGILSVVAMPEYRMEQMLAQEHTMLLILENIQDPGNLGTMLRTGEGAGVTGVIASGNTVDLYNPKTIRSTMGSIYRIPYLVAENWEETIQKIKDQGVALYAAHLQGTAAYDEPDYTTACGFLIGNEGNGLTEATARLADTYVRIPMAGKVESLNAAVSASLLMYECSRQRRKRQ